MIRRMKKKMKKIRIKIPQPTVDRLMFNADHTCCICKQKGRAIQINHIDGDPSNNDYDNLIVLCLEHHETVSRKSRMGKGYSVGELKSYKRHWEYEVRKNRGFIPEDRPKRKPLSPIEEIVVEVLSIPDGDKRACEKLDKLYEIYLWLGYKKEIFDALGHLSLIAGLRYTKLSVKLADIIYQLNWHFVDPKNVPIEENEVRRIRNSIEHLETIGQFAGEFNRKVSVIKAVCRNLQNFHYFAILYQKRDIEQKVVSALHSVKKACLTTYKKGEKRFLKGSKIVDETTESILLELEKERPSWKSIVINLKNKRLK